MTYELGLKALKRLCAEQDAYLWYRAKINPSLFKAPEIPVFEWVEAHFTKFHTLPHPDTLVAKFPMLGPVECPEPPAYYIDKLEHAFFFERINRANLASQDILKKDQNAHQPAMLELESAIRDIKAQQFRTRIVLFNDEGVDMVAEGHWGSGPIFKAGFGWNYMDHEHAGVQGGDVVSIVGRPALGKTWKVLYMGIHNWRKLKHNTIVFSMEMEGLPIVQRIAAMYANTNIKQLKSGGLSTSSWQKYKGRIAGVQDEEAKLYVVDGNLATCAEDVYELADLLKCPVILIDGAYLLRHKNPKISRYERAADNVELMKRYTTESHCATFASWQFNREGAKKEGKKGEFAGLEHIGSSDAISQISSIVLGLFQEEGVETMMHRTIRVLKGRNGEQGQFEVNWNFNTMNFDQVEKKDIKKPLSDL